MDPGSSVLLSRKSFASWQGFSSTFFPPQRRGARRELRFLLFSPLRTPRFCGEIFWLRLAALCSSLVSFLGSRNEVSYEASAPSLDHCHPWHIRCRPAGRFAFPPLSFLGFADARGCTARDT